MENKFSENKSQNTVCKFSCFDYLLCCCMPLFESGQYRVTGNQVRDLEGYDMQHRPTITWHLTTSLPDTLTYRDLYLWLAWKSWWCSHRCSGFFQPVTQPDSSAMDKCPEGKWNHSYLRSTVTQLRTHTHTQKHLCTFLNYTHPHTLDPLANRSLFVFFSVWFIGKNKDTNRWK